MTQFATLPTPERQLLIEQVATRLGIVPVIVEKDFWVCWSLARIFGTDGIAPHVVFKGGTSLSKVYGVIPRFSEDIDLAVAPESLGISSSDLDDAPSTSQRSKRVRQLAAQCEAFVEQHSASALEQAVTAILGPAPGGDQWFTYELDAVAGTPNLWFSYPSALPPAGGYVARRVKLEFGALTRQQPTGEHRISAMLASVLGAAYDDFDCTVTALDLARTFWEKATILHAEYHRPADLPMRDRHARHYADFALLWQHDSRGACLARRDLLEDVVSHKSRFFASAWANYPTATPGTFRLAPPAHRHAALARDYAAMQPMFMADMPTFAQLLDVLREAEAVLNRTDDDAGST